MSALFSVWLRQTEWRIHGFSPPNNQAENTNTWAECKKQLEAHGGKAENVTEVCMDMSPAFIKGAEENFPKAAITFDK
ncbi:transposase, partial [Acinetobacter baumannii]